MIHLSTEEIAIYIDALKKGKLDKVPRHIIEHIETCDECAAEVIDIYDTFNQQNELKNEKRKGSIFYIIGSAAAAAILLLIFFNKTMFKGENAHHQTQLANTIEQRELLETMDLKIDSLHKKPIQDLLDNTVPADKKILAAAYLPDKEFELLVERYKGTMRGTEIEMITTSVLELKSKKTVKLEWENPDKNLLTLEVYNNKATKIRETNIKGNSFEFSERQGLYYWKLFNRDYDLLFCGKIIIK